MSTKRAYYRAGPIIVNARRFITKRKTYRISAITNVEIRRTQFYLLLPFILGVLSLVSFYSELLYWDEMFISVISALFLGAASWSIGTLHLQGLSVDGMATMGLYWELEKIKAAIDKAIDSSERSNFTNRNQYR